MTLNTKVSNTEASPICIALTDEALPSLPLSVSKVREPQSHAEIEAMLNAVELEMRSHE